MSLQGLEKIQTQKSIYQDLIKVFSKFSTKVSDLSKRINDEILTPSLSKLSHNLKKSFKMILFLFITNFYQTPFLS